MKHIQKGREPVSFSAWKNLENENWKPNWADLQSPEKKDVHCSLIREQGYLCCYCMARIERSTSHIEHLIPRSVCTEQQRIDYPNLLASCNCGFAAKISECDDPYGEGDDRESSDQTTDNAHVGEHCGHKKSGWYDAAVMVSPLEDCCEDFFRYGQLSGKIKPVTDPDKFTRASETIRVLGLNAPILVRLRRKALDGVFQGLKSLSPADGHLLIEGYGRRDEEGRLTPFCAAIISVLKSQFGI